MRPPGCPPGFVAVSAGARSASVIRAVAVVVPAHDEEELLAGCLKALIRARGRGASAGLETQIVVVADACTDGTAAVARCMGARVVTTDVRNVGAARALGTAAALEDFERRGYRAREIWLAHTDADTLVPPDWFAGHLRYADRGWSAVLGTVRVADWSPRPAGSARLFEGRERLVPASERVHGANFGVRADAYCRAGGFVAADAGEDRALAAALRGSGAPVALARELTVRTSARVSRRVNGGFSDYLSALAEPA